MTSSEHDAPELPLFTALMAALIAADMDDDEIDRSRPCPCPCPRRVLEPPLLLALPVLPRLTSSVLPSERRLPV